MKTLKDRKLLIVLGMNALFWITSFVMVIYAST